MIQINPPFDGSAPCPMCSQEIRAISATAHNMLNRWRKGTIIPEPKFWSKLDDLAVRRSGPALDIPVEQVKSDNAEVQAHLDAIRDLVAEYRKHDRPQNDRDATIVAALISSLVDKLRETIGPVNLLGEVHFDDDRHASNRENVLRAQRGYSLERRGEYDWWVKPALPNASPDLIHGVCSTRLVIHEHFRERIRRDPTFYGQIWCPTCAQNLPRAQFECRVA